MKTKNSISSSPPNISSSDSRLALRICERVDPDKARPSKPIQSRALRELDTATRIYHQFGQRASCRGSTKRSLPLSGALPPLEVPATLSGSRAEAMDFSCGVRSPWQSYTEREWNTNWTEGHAAGVRKQPAHSTSIFNCDVEQGEDGRSRS